MIKKLDIFGISASIVCAIHCSLLPLAIAGGFLSNSYLMGHGVFELIFIGVSVFLAMSSLVSSYRYKHRKLMPLILFLIGLFSIFIGLQFHGFFEIILATSGGLIIALAHFVNIKLNKSFKFKHSILA